MKRLLRCLLLLSCAAIAAAQQSDTKPSLPSFDAASVTPFVSAPGIPVRAKMTGGPGTSAPGRIDYQGVTLGVLVQRAFNLPFYRLSAPAWANSQRYNVTATVPKGSTEEQFHQMLQRLLAERFRLVTRTEQREIPVYQLGVGRAGAKLKLWNPEDDRKLAEPIVDHAAQRLAGDADGYPILPAGTNFLILNGHARLRGVKAKPADLAEFLSGVADRPVIDRTGLEGEYGFTVSWIMNIPGVPAGPQSEPGPDLFGAVERQLGLKLESAKAPVQMLVVESAEKTPTAN